MASCSRCHGRGQIESGGFFGWSVCTHCSGTGQEPTGKPADWFFGDAEPKGGGKSSGGWGCWTILMSVLAAVLVVILWL